MQDLLECCQANLLEARARSSFQKFYYHSVSAPQWAHHDELMRVYREKKKLLKKGRVVWGCIVQASPSLFEPGPLDLPVEVVFCKEDGVMVVPEKLQQIAEKVLDLKGTARTDPEEAELALAVTSDTSRASYHKIPATISPDFSSVMSVTVVIRKHLPFGFLTHKLLPILISPPQTSSVIVLPGRYWPDALKDR